MTRVIIQKNVDLRSLWSDHELNIATFSRGLSRKLEKVDLLDCVGCYCKCDPVKSGCLDKKVAMAHFESKIVDLKNFEKGAVKLKKN